MTEIPVQAAPAAPQCAVNSTNTSRTHRLVGRFRKLAPRCRELVRRRLHGLKKQGASATDIETEAQQLPTPLFDLASRRLFISLAKEALQDESGLLDELWLVDYVEVPPTIEQFILDPRFLGQTLKPEDNSTGIWPTWLELLCAHYDLNSEVDDAVLTGALGTGKTCTVVVIMLYRMCLATMLRNLQKFYNMNRSSYLAFAFLSITRATVRNTAFSEALNLMFNSSYFVEICQVNPKLNYSACQVEMKRVLPDGRLCGIVLIAGSKSQHTVGLNMIAVALDEGNFRLEAQPDEMAYQIYQKSRARMESRFYGFPGCLSLIASSAADESSFTQKVVREICESGNTRTKKVHRFAVYQMARPGVVLSNKWFKVCYGLANCEPYILQGRYAPNGTPLGTGPHEEPPKGASVELVPEDFWESFRRDARAALQDLSGISISGTHRLFPSAVDLENCIEISTAEGVLNPMVGNTELVALSLDSPYNIWDYIEVEKLIYRANSQNRPLRHPERPRYAHVDLAETSAGGLAICHLVAQKPQVSLNAQGESFTDFRLIVEYDLILKIVPGANGHISIEKVQNLFIKMREWGFQFAEITYDMFQSTLSLQMLESRGFKAARLSIDRDKTAYTALRIAAQDHRLRFYRHPTLLRELTTLVDCGKKFNHPPGSGTKDVSDAFAGAYLNATNGEDKNYLGIENLPVTDGIGIEPMSVEKLQEFNFLEEYMKKNKRSIGYFKV